MIKSICTIFKCKTRGAVVLKSFTFFPQPLDSEEAVIYTPTMQLAGHVRTVKSIESVYEMHRVGKSHVIIINSA